MSSNENAEQTEVTVDDSQKEGKDEKEKEEEEEVPDMGGTKRLSKEYGQKYCCYTFGGYLFAFLNGSVMPLFGVLFREILAILTDSINPITGETNFAERSLRTLVYFVGMGLGAGIFTILQYYFWGTYGTRVAMDVRSEWFTALMQQDITFHDKETSGKLNALLTTETAAVEAGIGLKMGVLIQQLASFVVGMFWAFYFSWQMTLVLLGIMPVLICIGAIQGLMYQNAGKNSDPFVNAGSFSQEVLTNIRTVAAFPDLAVSKYQGFVEKVQEGFPISAKRALITGFSLGALMFGALGIMYAVGLYAGARFVDAGFVSQANMFGAFFSFMIAGMGLGQLGSVLPDLGKAAMGANKFYATKSRVPEIKPPDNGLESAVIGKGKWCQSIEFKNVSFSYASAPDTTVLHDVSFTVSAGSTVAIVGPSGSGKSTIIGLIERFYDPTAGSIVIDSDNFIHNYDVNSLRGQMSFVAQMPLLFDASIEDNIRGGNQETTQQDIEQAAKLANAHEFILNLPNGYKTSVGELGGRLSGGQRQRIAIARAMLSQPSLLLLDEATSALDSKSEKEVQDAIDKIAETRNQTVIAIAHRLSTIKHADNIIVLVDGKIREQGNHHELMEKNDIYAALCRAQTLVEQKKQVHQKQRSVQLGSQDLDGLAEES